MSEVYRVQINPLYRWTRAVGYSHLHAIPSIADIDDNTTGYRVGL